METLGALFLGFTLLIVVLGILDLLGILPILISIYNFIHNHSFAFAIGFWLLVLWGVISGIMEDRKKKKNAKNEEDKNNDSGT